MREGGQIIIISIKIVGCSDALREGGPIIILIYIIGCFEGGREGGLYYKFILLNVQ